MCRLPAAAMTLLFLCIPLPPVRPFPSLYNATRKLSDKFRRPMFLNRAANDRTTGKMIQSRGYPFEAHHVKTEDGYVLELHRIPHGKYRNSSDSRRYPVIVQHGNFQSSADWVLNTPDSESLGFYLADKGYDVWLGNQRGNTYSIGHNNTLLHGNAFWNFSVHEMGVYDFPAVVDYVINTTGKKKTHHVSFSMGTTSLFVGLSKRPEYSEKIGVGVAMGPSAFQRNFWHWVVQLLSPFLWFMQVFQQYTEHLPVISPFGANLLHQIIPILCHPKLDVFGICVRVVRLSMGNDKGLITKERLRMISKVTPTSSSMKASLHQMQMMESGRFCEYDYGTERNKLVYGSDLPPEYNLTNVRANVAMLVGPNDVLADVKDAKTLASKLPNLVEFHYVPDNDFTHIDFCYATDVETLVYKHVVKLLRRFDNS